MKSRDVTRGRHGVLHGRYVTANIRSLFIWQGRLGWRVVQLWRFGKGSAAPSGTGCWFVVFPGLGSAGIAEPSWATFGAVPFGTLKAKADSSPAKSRRVRNDNGEE